MEISEIIKLVKTFCVMKTKITYNLQDVTTRQDPLLLYNV